MKIHDFFMTIHVQNWQYSCLSEGYGVDTTAFLNVHKSTSWNVVYTRVQDPLYGGGYESILNLISIFSHYILPSVH